MKILANGEKKMKIIEVDEELYQYIAAQTRSIGESASDIQIGRASCRERV